VIEILCMASKVERRLLIHCATHPSSNCLPLLRRFLITTLLTRFHNLKKCDGNQKLIDNIDINRYNIFIYSKIQIFETKEGLRCESDGEIQWVWYGIFP